MARPDVTRLTETEFQAIGPWRWLADALGRHRNGLDGAVRRLESAERDDEAIHDLRVSTRRIRGLLDAGREFLPGKPVRRLNKGLKEARRDLGPARDAEVGAELLGELKSSLGPEVLAAAGAMAGQLLARRDAAGSGDVKSSQLRKLVTRLTRVIRDLEDHRWPDTDPPMTLAEFRHLALATLRERWDEVRWLPLEPIEQHDAVAQHAFRIKAKKLRYSLELFAPLVPKPIERRLALLKAMQDQLGHLHDLAGVEHEARGLAARSREAGFPEVAAGFEALAARLEDERHRGLDGFLPRYQGLVHPGFLPPEAPRPAAPAGTTPVAATSDDTTPDTTAPGITSPEADAAPAPDDANPKLRVIDGGREESA